MKTDTRKGKRNRRRRKKNCVGGILVRRSKNDFFPTGKDLHLALHGPPPLPKPLQCLDLPSMVHYCEQLITFETELDPNILGWPAWYATPPVGDEEATASHYRDVIKAFFQHHSLDLRYIGNLLAYRIFLVNINVV